MQIIERNSFLELFEILKQKGYKIIGPTIQDNAIVYDELSKVEDLPIGWTDEQEAGYDLSF